MPRRPAWVGSMNFVAARPPRPVSRFAGVVRSHLGRAPPRFGRMSSERASISPDLVHHIFQLQWETRERERAAAEAGGTGAGDVAAGAGAARKKVPVKDEALAASAELLRAFVEELAQRAADIAKVDGDDVVDGSHLERCLTQFLLDFAT